MKIEINKQSVQQEYTPKVGDIIQSYAATPSIVLIQGIESDPFITGRFKVLILQHHGYRAGSSQIFELGIPTTNWKKFDGKVTLSNDC